MHATIHASICEGLALIESNEVDHQDWPCQMEFLGRGSTGMAGRLLDNGQECCLFRLACAVEPCLIQGFTCNSHPRTLGRKIVLACSTKMKSMRSGSKSSKSWLLGFQHCVVLHKAAVHFGPYQVRAAQLNPGAAWVSALDKVMVSGMAFEPKPERAPSRQ